MRARSLRALAWLCAVCLTSRGAGGAREKLAKQFLWFQTDEAPNVGSLLLRDGGLGG